ncbi:hypothetical protein FA788_04650 [Escherichia coli]|nr:hypothetical protein [Escherichia coli]
METVLENIRQGLNRPSHRHERVRGCMSLFVAGVTIFAQYGPLAPLGRGLGCGEKRPPCRSLLRSDLATIATHSQVDYNNRLSVRTVY